MSAPWVEVSALAVALVLVFAIGVSVGRRRATEPDKLTTLQFEFGDRDVVVLETSHALSMDAAQRIRENFAALIAGESQVAVIGDGLRLAAVLKRPQAPPSEPTA